LLPSDALPDPGGGGGGGEASTQEFSATYDFQELELLNFPEWADESTHFYIYKLNEKTLLDSVTKAAPQAELELKRLTDTLIEIRFTLDDERKTKRVKVTFKLPSAHKIKSGEALSKIAERYGIKKDSLMKWNKIANENSIQKDQVILLKPEVLNTTETEETEEVDGAASSNGELGPKTTNEKKAGGSKNANSNGQADASSSSNKLEKLKGGILVLIKSKSLSVKDSLKYTADLIRSGDDIKKLEDLETTINKK
jgi:LysM repeat protein